MIHAGLFSISLVWNLQPADVTGWRRVVSLVEREWLLYLCYSPSSGSRASRRKEEVEGLKAMQTVFVL